MTRDSRSQPSIDTLRGAWLFANCRWSADAAKLIPALNEIESDMKSRGGYHSVSHIERMLAKYGQWCDATGSDLDSRVVTWVFAHDLVYKPGAPDNEERSFLRMDEVLHDIGARLNMDRDDRTAIESTRSHESVDPALLDDTSLVESIHLLHDLDLEILGSSRLHYDAYTEAVYVEYLAATDEPSSFNQRWVQGRRGFLQGMLERERIFKTPLFAMFEQHAHDNMTAELGKLGA